MKRLLILYSLIGCCFGISAAEQSPDQKLIATVMRGIWEHPDSPLSIDPVVVIDNYAIAGWVQGERGGRALLHKSSNKWLIQRCGGDGLKTVAALETAGVPNATAKKLVRSINDEEAKTDPATRKKMSSFQGIITMDEHHKSHHNP